MKRIYIVETKDGRWLYYRRARVKNGLVSLGNSTYEPNPSRARIRQFRSWVPPFWMKTFQVFPFRQGDPETIPYFNDIDGKKFPLPRHSGEVIHLAMTSRKAELLLRSEVNFWVWITILLAILALVLGGALYSAHAPR